MSPADCNRNAQHESCELSFVAGKMRTIAWEIEPLRELCGAAPKRGGAVNTCVILARQVCAVKHTFRQGLTVGYEEQKSPLMVLVLL